MRGIPVSLPENERLITALEQVPETRLAIVDLLETLPEPRSWKKQLLTAEQEEELENAVRQTIAYIQQTHRLQQDLEEMLRRNRGW